MKKPPVRSYDQTTFTWSLSKRLKAEMSVLADMNHRTLSNWIKWRLTPLSEALIQRRTVLLTDKAIEESLRRGITNT